MPHVSKQRLKKSTFLDIHKQLFKAVAELSRSSKSRALLDQLLTKTEKLMLAKRLAIIFMLDQKESMYAISQVLKVSPSTVARMSVQYDNGSYTVILEEIQRQKSFWVQLQKIIPPRVGRNRFKNFLQFD